MNSKINKLFSFALVTALIGTTLHCSATNIVPVNGGNGNVAVPPAAPVTKTTVDSKSLSRGFSLQMMKSKIDEVISPRRSEAQLRDNPSGTCGNDCSWLLDTSTGVLTISGTGEMTGFPPWLTYRSSIKSVTINDGITSIVSNAFNGCSALTSVEISKSVTTIGEYAFSYCSALTSVYIPNSVTSIEKNAFDGCSKLKSAIIGNNVASIGDKAFMNCVTLESVMLGNNVTTIGEYAFAGCSELTSVDIPNSVTSIGKEAFSYCKALTSINIPNLVTFIGESAFESCNALKTITLPDSITSIENSTFLGCSALTSVVIPNSVTSIGNSAFRGCNVLTSVDIPDSVISVGGSAFESCSALTTISVPASVTSIGTNAFWSGRALTSVTLNNNYAVSIFRSSSFPYSYVKNITLGDKVTSIGDHAFSDCGLTTITIPDSVTSIGSSAFFNCVLLSHVCYLGANDPGKFSTYVFEHCDNLKRVSVTKVYTDNSFCGKKISQGDKCVVSGATLSAKPVIWAIAATACLVPTVIFSFLM